jgi:uncharacterized pyridoxamine 5'-phosphate oxidase family protein
MSKPALKPIASAELVSLSLGVMKAAKFPQLATIDGDQPRLRPVSPVRTDGFNVDDHHNQVRITGTAEVLTDRPMLEEIWNSNPLLRQYLGSLENPMLIVYRIQPNRVRYMVEWALEYYEVPIA